MVNTFTIKQARFDAFRREQVAGKIMERYIRTNDDFDTAVAVIRDRNNGDGFAFDGPAEFGDDADPDRYARYSRQTVTDNELAVAVDLARAYLLADGWPV
jgi:hypothetical protein